MKKAIVVIIVMNIILFSGCTSLMKLIKLEKEVSTCEFSTRNAIVECIENKYNSTRDTSVCDEFSRQDYKDICLKFAADDKANPEICEDIVDSNTRDACIIEVGRIIGDISLCDSVRDPYEYGLRETCITLIAEKLGDTESCKKIPDMDMRDSCIYNAVVGSGDEGECKLIRDDASRDGCYYQIAEMKKDTTLCMEIGDLYDRLSCKSITSGKVFDSNAKVPEVDVYYDSHGIHYYLDKPVSSWTTYSVIATDTYLEAYVDGILASNETARDPIGDVGLFFGTSTDEEYTATWVDVDYVKVNGELIDDFNSNSSLDNWIVSADGIGAFVMNNVTFGNEENRTFMRLNSGNATAASTAADSKGRFMLSSTPTKFEFVVRSYEKDNVIFGSQYWGISAMEFETAFDSPVDYRGN